MWLKLIIENTKVLKDRVIVGIFKKHFFNKNENIEDDISRRRTTKDWSRTNR